MKKVEIDDGLYKKLSFLASNHGKNITSLVELILKAFIKKYSYIYDNNQKQGKKKKVIKSNEIVSVAELESLLKELH